MSKKEQIWCVEHHISSTNFLTLLVFKLFKLHVPLTVHAFIILNYSVIIHFILIYVQLSPIIGTFQEGQLTGDIIV